MVARTAFAAWTGFLLGLALPITATASTIAPVDSSLALASNGGGCYLPASTSLLDQLALVNPEWAPVVNGSNPVSTPVLVHGTAVESHVSQEDFPAGHVSFDQNTSLALDSADAGLLATGNYNSELVNGQPTLELEREAGSYPAWAWAGVGDRVVALGRWIFDCGHPNPSATGVLNYRSELHPPQAVAVIRSGGGAVLQDGSRPVPATRADVYVSGDGGGAGDACVVTHRPTITALVLGPSCFPLSAPLAQLNATDFSFDVPLPAVPGGRNPVLTVIQRPTPSLSSTPVPARLDSIFKTDANGSNPRFHVTVHMTELVNGTLPTGLAATLEAGWLQSPNSPMVHLRVTLDGITVNDALKPTLPFGLPTPPGWKLQADVNGQWQEIGGLDQVNSSSVGDFIPVSAVFDQYMPRSGTLRLESNAASKACVDTMFGQSLLTDLLRFGFDPTNPATLGPATQLGFLCLSATEADAGSVETSYAAPSFGASETAYQVVSDNGAYTLTYQIEHVEDA
jgi:hypothetical protein